MNIKLLKQKVLKRDNFTCTKCKRTLNKLDSNEYMCIHHIKSRENHPDKRLDINNCVILCNTCHYKVHNNIRKQYKKKVRWIDKSIEDIVVNNYEKIAINGVKFIKLIYYTKNGTIIENFNYWP